MRIFKLVSLFLGMFSFFTLDAKKYDYVIYAQDAGETYAFLPLLSHLEENNANYLLLVGGVAEEICAKKSLFSEKICSIKTFGVNIDKTGPRSQEISDQKLFSITDNLEPKVFLTGVAFHLQKQLLDAFSQKGVRTVAYWDNFGTVGDDPYFSIASTVEKSADFLFLPSQKHLLSPLFQKRFPDQIYVVGQPSLEEWKKIYRPAFSKNNRWMVYVGGYGAQYEEAFELFLDEISQCEIDYEIFVLPHPKFEGAFEKKSLQRTLKKNPHLCVHIEKSMTTQEAVYFSDLVICHQSSVGIQAISLDKPVIYLIPSDQNFTNFALDINLAKRAFNHDSFQKALEDVMQEPAFDFYEISEIPENGSEIFFQTLDHISNL